MVNIVFSAMMEELDVKETTLKPNHKQMNNPQDRVPLSLLVSLIKHDLIASRHGNTMRLSA